MSTVLQAGKHTHTPDLGGKERKEKATTLPESSQTDL